MESETGKWMHPSIIAMKGHPFTGKSSIAREIGMLLRYCTLIHLDDILDSITLTKSLDDDEAAAMPSQLQEDLVEQGFEFLLKVAETQIRLGVSVVIDSPLSSPTHFQRLIELTSSASAYYSMMGLIVVECKAEKIYDWEMRFEEEYLNKSTNNKLKWYKPKCWGDIEKIIQRDTLSNSNNSNNYPCPSRVCRLVLNVDQEVNVREAFQVMQKMNQEHQLLNEENRLVVYEHYISEKKSKIRMEEGPHLKHNVCVFHEKGLIITSTTTHNYICWLCEIPVVPGVDPAYTCASQSCSLALHKACAELSDNYYDPADNHEENKKKKIINMIPNSNSSNTIIIVRSRWEIIPQRFPHFLIDNGYYYRYLFPAKYQCFDCKDKEGFSYDCVFCLFKTHLKCRLIPTILRHEGHNHKNKEEEKDDHFLFLDLNTVRHSDSQSHIYRCTACGLSSLSSTSGNYSCSYKCTAPGCHATRFHPQCLMLPRSELHHHSGHQHLVNLQFSREEEFDEYLCDICCEKMSPDSWFYYCQECDLTFHLNCLDFTDYTN